MSWIFKYPIKLLNNCQVIARRNYDKKHIVNENVPNSKIRNIILSAVENKKFLAIAMTDISMTPYHHFQTCVVLENDDMDSLKYHSSLSLIFILNCFSKTSVISLLSSNLKMQQIVSSFFRAIARVHSFDCISRIINGKSLEITPLLH